MEEVLVWVMGDGEGRRVIIGSFGTRGLIYHETSPERKEPYKDSRWMPERGVPREAVDLTENVEHECEMIISPTVLRVPPPPTFNDARLYSWVDEEIVPVVEARMKVLRQVQRVAEIRRKQAAGRSS